MVNALICSKDGWTGTHNTGRFFEANIDAGLIIIKK